VNKVATKVELRFDLEHTAVLSVACRARLRSLAANRLDSDGCLVITSQATRTQSQNLEDARAKLVALIRAALVVPKVRRPTKPTAASKRRRLDAKQRTAKRKQERASGKRSDWT
jgi:ribosome-associated protein